MNVPPDVYHSRDFEFLSTAGSDTPRGTPVSRKKTSEETSFSRTRTPDTRYRSLHTGNMQNRPLPEIPEYDVPSNSSTQVRVPKLEEQETLLVRGNPEDGGLPNDVILPNNLNLPSERLRPATKEERRQMQNMIRSHPNNMTLFASGPNMAQKLSKNPRLHATTMGRVLREHPSMLRGSPVAIHQSPVVLKRAPPPDVICVETHPPSRARGPPEPIEPLYSEELTPQAPHEFVEGHTQLRNQTEPDFLARNNREIQKIPSSSSIKSNERPLSV